MNSTNPVILCVDDEETYLNLLEAILVSNGYEVVTASNGPDALLKIKRQTIDLVLLDINMPEMDGFEVCRKIKEDKELVDIPIVMVTGLTSSEDHVRGIEVGVDDYFTKPVKKTELLARIKILLKMKKLGDERKRAEEALKKSHDELDDQVKLRTAELKQVNEMLQADIADRKRIEDELRRNQDIAERLAQEMAIIAEIGLVISSTLHIDEVYERFAAEIRNLIPIDSLTVNLYNFQDNTLRVAYVSGVNIDGRRPGDPLVMEGSLSGAVVRTRTSRRIQPENIDVIVGQFPRLSPIFNVGMRSIMCVPLVYRDEVIGVLHFRSIKQNAYTEQDQRLAERIGMQIAGAIANAKLYYDIEKKEKSLRVSEGRFRGLVEKAAVGVAEIEMNTGRFLMVNSRLCEMMGRTEEEMLNTTFQTITHREDLHLHEEKTRMMLAGEIGHYSLEKRYLRKDRGIVWVNLTVSPLWKPGEAPGRNMIVVEDITERKRMEAEIIALSVTDQLTGLHNRRGFLSLAGQQLKMAERNKSGMLLFFADLDGLKWINDTLGHEEGDRAIIEAATVLKETFRVSDIVARLGGDEYAVLAFYITGANSGIVTARLQSLIDRRNSQENRKYRLSISVGCSYYDPGNPCSIDELMASADKLMYGHKQNKKDLLLHGASLSTRHLHF
jgi:diguanylate cyclase (GGDEF)-like protein/PAS domain S-box-containing protein